MDEHRIEHLTEEARDSIEAGKYLRAVAITDQLASMVSDDAEISLLRAKALLGSESGEDALTESQHAVELNPGNGEAYVLLGVAAWRLDRLTLAQESLERAIELTNSDPGILADYAWFMASERGPRLAEEAALCAVEADGGCSTAWAALAMAQYRLRHRDEAERSAARALQLDPNDPYALSVQVTILQERGEEDQAMALANVMEETPGTESFVQEVRERNREKAVERILVERGVDLTHSDGSGLLPRVLYLLLTFAAIAGLVFFSEPATWTGAFLCCFGPLFVYWFYIFRTS